MDFFVVSEYLIGESVVQPPSTSRSTLLLIMILILIIILILILILILIINSVFIAQQRAAFQWKKTY